MDIKIELGKINDVDQLEELYNDLNNFLEEGINYPGWRKGLYPVRQNAIDGINDGNLYIAKHNNRVVGSLILSHKPESGYDKAKWTFESDYSDVLVIYTFAVHPGFFKCGIGKSLIDFSFERGVKSNVKSIRLDVYENNVPAIKLYEKCGFKYIDTVDLGYGEYGLDQFKLYEKML
ncbi:GNAT family N-acetyltransferase [Clostridium sp. SHJSY1]|uniref:GNAT family N-acetyltransferase n=1 Tax=Clostridium sp. SHJSY1 TaxID=2942483 RepID=UPI002875ADA4|nr:GNAT family N-acetyltransferase [Clostridium sp. SHJSY1]MDS0525642.1 GNAT family N-acetyltransferase [Clostridium sp. SHJSY1]